jgi:hypothetical protein
MARLVSLEVRIEAGSVVAGSVGLELSKDNDRPWQEKWTTILYHLERLRTIYSDDAVLDSIEAESRPVMPRTGFLAGGATSRCAACRCDPPFVTPAGPARIILPFSCGKRPALVDPCRPTKRSAATAGSDSQQSLPLRPLLRSFARTRPLTGGLGYHSGPDFSLADKVRDVLVMSDSIFDDDWLTPES